VPTLAKPGYSGLNVSSRAFWPATAEEREVVFEQLRDHEPVSLQRPPPPAVTATTAVSPRGLAPG